MSPRNPKEMRHEQEQQIGQEAGEWLADLEQPDAGDRYAQPERRREAFLLWLSRSPRHARVFSETIATRRRLQSIDAKKKFDVDAMIRSLSSAAVIPLYQTSDALSSEQKSSVHSSIARRAPWRIAAALLLCILSAVALMKLDSPRSYATDIGEQRVSKLADGSIVTLNTHSQVGVNFSEEVREIRLVRGEALFTVEQDPRRPFVVAVGDATVRALGTTFNVRRRNTSTDVSVIEGAVRVTTASNDSSAEQRTDRTPAQAAKAAYGKELNLTAGEAAQIQDGLVSKRADAQISEQLAWRERRLVFRDTPLEEIAAEFNRYNRTQIQVEGAAGQKRMSGIFEVDRPQSVILFTQEDSTLTVIRRGEDWLISQR